MSVACRFIKQLARVHVTANVETVFFEGCIFHEALLGFQGLHCAPYVSTKQELRSMHQIFRQTQLRTGSKQLDYWGLAPFSRTFSLL
jgi:hypothetical protein